MRHKYAGVCFCAAVGSFFAGAQTPNRAAKVKRLDEVATYYSQQGRFMGTVLVAEGDDVLLSKGYGYANLEWQIPQQPDAEFHLASLSKQFTAVAVLLLQEGGKLRTGDPISRYLPNLPEAWKALTVDNLLNQTSGLKEVLADPRFAAWSMLPQTVPEQMAFIHDYPLEFAPGSKFAYCNTNYVLLAMIVEAVSGMRFRDFLQQRIFTKLGMLHTGTDTDALVLPHRAEGYTKGTAGFERVRNVAFSVSIVDGGAGVYSSTGDLLIWEKALFGGKILNQVSLAFLTHRGLGNYGAGEFNDTRHGETVIEHSGGMEGANTSLSYLPDRKITVIALGNIDRSAKGLMSDQFMDVLLGDPVVLGQDAAVLPIVTLEKLVGVYLYPSTAPDDPVTLSVVDGHLLIQLGTGKKNRAFYEGSMGSSLRFVVPDRDYEFQMDTSGTLPKMHFHWDFDVELTRQ